MPTQLDYTIETNVIHEGYDRQTCWVQTRGAVIPPKTGVITTQKLRLSGSDIFFDIHSMRSDDGGKTWSEPVTQPGLGRQAQPDGTEDCPCDGTPAWHTPSGTLLATGHTALYRDDKLVPGVRKRDTWYSVYDPTTSLWSPMKTVIMPDPEHFYCVGGGCTQRVDLDDGTILLPIYIRERNDMSADGVANLKATVMHCHFDGKELTYLEHGDELTCPTPRGLYEPSLARFDGRFFLTLRNDEHGYVTCGTDGLSFEPPRHWTFDDGEALGNYNTQQHWITHSDALFLVYTRRGGGNDHVFRHRAPLFMAQVDPDRLCVIRDTERIVVPEHGARLGNFGTAMVNRDESWVVASEWMQTNPPNCCDSTVCERYGSNNRIFVSRIRWDQPNMLATA